MGAKRITVYTEGRTKRTYAMAPSPGLIYHPVGEVVSLSSTYSKKKTRKLTKLHQHAAYKKKRVKIKKIPILTF